MKANAARFYLQGALRTVKCTETEGRIPVARGWRKGKCSVFVYWV